MMNRYSLALFALVASCQAQAQTQTTPEVTPYRPGVGSPAVLSAPGYLELEVGYDRFKSGSSQSQVLSGLLKYGLNDQFGLLLGQPWQQVSDAGAKFSGLGDGLIGLKFVKKLNSEFATGLQLTSSLLTGKQGVFRANKTTNAVTGLLGFDFSGLHADVNLGLTRLGDVEPGESRNQTGYSLGVSKALEAGWGLGLEVSGTRRSGSASTTALLGSASYTVTKTLAVDASISRSKSAGISATAAGLGFTYLFAN
jgi:hypothetical protein